MQDFTNVHGNKLLVPIVNKESLQKDSENHSIHLKQNLANFKKHKAVC